MTITYTAEVATCRGFGCFLKLLLRWRGSIYKLVWLDLLAFLTLYYVLNIVYRHALNASQKEVFEAVVLYCEKYSNLIPLSFVLGFYVSIVMTRWWNQYTSIPWPDPIAVFVSAHVHGQDERGRVMRRTVMRYVCLCLTMVLTSISPRVKKRFPNLSHLVEAGLLNDNEKAIIESMNKGFPRHSKHWLPIVWAASIVTRARKEGRIRDDFAVKTIIDELNQFRGRAGLLLQYDTISVPLVYTQVVTLAVYSYFLCGVMGQQWTESKQDVKIDLYFPIFTTLQFFFYMGWLKVAESLINPFGEDDDDFEVNWMVDRNLQVAYLIVDEMHHEHPQLIRDQYWDEVFPNELPYTVASERFREEHPEPSTAKIEVAKKAAMPSTLSTVRIDEMVGKETAPKVGDAANQLLTVNYKFPDEEEADDATSGIHFTAGNGKPRRGSSPSLGSVAGTMSRVNTVASALKRLLSREDSRQGSITPNDDGQKNRFPNSGSSTSLTGAAAAAQTAKTGTVRLTDQVIEEVDEQATITSMKDKNAYRLNVRDIFSKDNEASSAATTTTATASTAAGAAPARSEPINIPIAPPSYMRAVSGGDGPHLFPPGGVDALLSSSVPIDSPSAHMIRTAPTTPMAESTKSLFEGGFKDKGSRETVEDMEMKHSTEVIAAAENQPKDEFEKLKATREKERIERQNKKLARTISTAPTAESIVPMVAAAIVPATLLASTAPLSNVSSTVDVQNATAVGVSPNLSTATMATPTASAATITTEAIVTPAAAEESNADTRYA